MTERKQSQLKRMEFNGSFYNCVIDLGNTRKKNNIDSWRELGELEDLEIQIELKNKETKMNLNAKKQARPQEKPQQRITPLSPEKTEIRRLEKIIESQEEQIVKLQRELRMYKEREREETQSKEETEKPEFETQCSVFISNIVKAAAEEDMKMFLEGNIVAYSPQRKALSCRVESVKFGKKPGSAVVALLNEKSFKKALSFNKIKFLGKQIKIEPYFGHKIFQVNGNLQFGMSSRNWKRKEIFLIRKKICAVCALIRRIIVLLCLVDIF